VVAEEADYVVLCKPHNMHTAPLRADEGGTLLDWAATRWREVLLVRGRKAVEGGVLHRLDYGTAGLVLVARTQGFYDAVVAQQAAGRFVKGYVARCRAAPALPAGFPLATATLGELPVVIASGFRAYGVGRRMVRPVVGEGKQYATRVVTRLWEDDGAVTLGVGLAAGFRHQVRCHLAWLGLPIVNDTLYGAIIEGGPLQLSATSIAFDAPDGRRSYTVDPT
jgi:23S rRNA pseudouridine1911/1915/1917 synthase